MKIGNVIKKAGIGSAIIYMSLSANLVSAQEISDEHLKAARAAVSALQVTNSFDNILPAIADRIKGTLIQANPNFADEITLTVDEEAIKMAGRRAALENEAATIYAKGFTIEELQVISNFYDSDAGKKLLQISPGIGQQLVRSAEIWGAGIRRDLDAASNTSLKAKLNKAAPAATDAEKTE